MERIRVEATVNEPFEKVWDFYTKPSHIVGWNFASDDWHCPKAESDLRAGGKFSSRMEAKDGSEGFDFGGTYEEVLEHERVAYAMDDGRKAIVQFEPLGNSTHVSVEFEPETINPIEMQKGGWQAILENFKRYAESH